MDLQGIYQATLGWLVKIMFVTDPAATFNHPLVQHFWSIALYVTDALSAIFFIFAGYQIMFSGFGSRYAQTLDVLPRAVFSLVAAHFSLTLAAVVIVFNNYLCGIFLSQQDILTFFTSTTTGGMGLFLVPLLIVQGLVALLLCLQMVARAALLDFLIVILPWLIILLSSRTTEHIGQAGIQAYFSVVLIQSLQVLVLVLGERVMLPFFLASIGAQSELAPLASLIIGLAIFWLSIQLPMIVGRIVLHPVAQTGNGVRQLITFLVARLV